MRYQRGTDVERNGGSFVLAIAIGAILLVAAIVAIANANPVVALLLGVAWLFQYIGLFRPRVVLTPTEIHIYNPFSDDVVPYSEVTAVDFAGSFWIWGALEIDRGHGRKGGISPGLSVGWGHRPPWLDYLAYDIKQRAKAAQQE